MFYCELIWNVTLTSRCIDPFDVVWGAAQYPGFYGDDVSTEPLLHDEKNH